MGRLYLEFLDDRHYKCRACGCHLALASCLISKSFHSRNGRAYLFDAVVNTWPGKQEERTMTTGKHTVADLHCTSCMALVGWTYLSAEEPSQQYKQGKAILERAKVVSELEYMAACPQPVSCESDSES